MNKLKKEAQNKIMINVILGIVAGLGAALGLGGGTILILLLNFFTQINQHKIQGINLIFFIPTALVSIWVNSKNKIIDWKVAKKCIISGVFGSLLGAFVARKNPKSKFKKIFWNFFNIDCN